MPRARSQSPLNRAALPWWQRCATCDADLGKRASQQCWECLQAARPTATPADDALWARLLVNPATLPVGGADDATGRPRW